MWRSFIIYLGVEIVLALNINIYAACVDGASRARKIFLFIKKNTLNYF